MNTRLCTTTNLSLEDGDSLVLEGLGELDDLGSLRVDGERRHDHVSSVGLIHQLPNEARPLLLAFNTKRGKVLAARAYASDNR